MIWNDQDGNGKVQQVPEEADGERGHHQRKDDQLLGTGLGRRGPTDQDRDRSGQGEPDGADAERERRHGQEEEERPTQAPAAEGIAFPDQRTRGQRETDESDERRDRAG